MKLIKVEPSNDGKTKLTASFLRDDGKTSTVKFGIHKSFSYIDGASKEIRDAYRARHRRDILNKNPTTKGNLSYYITWGESNDINKNIRDYKRMFNV
jgi:hypothetical protein